MKKLLAIILLALAPITSTTLPTCEACGNEHPYVERGVVVEIFGDGNAVTFRNQRGEEIEWYISDEPTSIQVGDEMTVIGCEIIEINGQRY